MVTRETAFIPGGCDRCGGALCGELGEVCCFNCGWDPSAQMTPEIMALAREPTRHVSRRINGVFDSG